MADSSRRVAFVADDLMLRSRLEPLIADAGVEVQSVATASGVSMLIDSDDAPHAVVLDLSSRHVDPLAVVSRLRARFPNVPIVAFGPHTAREALLAATREGCEVVLPRSRAVRDLTRELRDLLERSAGSTRATLE